MREPKSKTVVPAGIAAIAQRFWKESSALPPGTWANWWKTLVIGLGVSSLIVYGLTSIAMRQVDTGLQAWDEAWLLKMRDYSPLSFSKGVTWESPGNLVGMLPVFFTFTVLTAWFRKPVVAATVVATYIGQFALVWISWGMWSRDRPDLIANGIAAPSLHSFPSGHVVVSVTMYGLLFYLWFRSSRNPIEKVVSILFAIVWIGLISLSRLALGAHWPSDVLAGWFVGLLWLTTVIVAMNRALEFTKHKPTQ
ncbi:phosphatase PAP2 family protein [cf. Phormidesmis sp. LEGE 11477]|uniref:phosphatase PAP2 family protein n=1 Tax=cf. Phormidesmis sp. LEGE 11477 TaxID=1828680 RepID=UPI00187E9F27|nr:phosphatase PAP2 family protein [cf. Phormidesmis sp. LEGE 11477]MBE9061815.1 phosphatase PAP2 family protein [cf. Phormidesmis sp. LEGE 11477]